MRMPTVGPDAVAKLHAHEAVSERSRVGAAERARLLGVGVDVFGELEFFVREAKTHHKLRPHAVTQRLVRHDGVKLLEGIFAVLQLGFNVVFMYHPGKLVRDFVSERRRFTIRKVNNRFPKPPVSRDAQLHNFISSPSTSLRRRLSARHRMRNISTQTSCVVVALSYVPLRKNLFGFGCLTPPFHGSCPVTLFAHTNFVISFRKKVGKNAD